MPQKTLGLDIGSYSIKAALFDTTFRSFELTDLFESTPLKADELSPEDRPVVITEAIIRLIEENRLKPSTVITALPGMEVSTRILTLPLPEKQISKVLSFELEAQIPFGLDEVIVSHHTISSEKNKTTVLASAVQKGNLARHLSLVKAAHLDPAFVGLDSLSLYSLNLMTLFQETGTYAVIDVGHQKSSVCIVSDHQVRYVRTLLTAGKHITDSIRAGLDLTLDQAIEVKHDHGVIELEEQPLKSKDLRRLSNVITKSVDPIIRDIIQTFHSYRALYANITADVPPIERIFLCGGTTLIQNLPEYISNLTNLPVKRLRFFSEDHEVSTKLGPRQSILAQAVGIGLRAAARGANAKRTATINFRKDDFAFAQDLSDIRKKAFFFGRWAAAIFLVALLHMGMKYNNLSRQYGKIEQEIGRIFRDIARDVKDPPKTSSMVLKVLKHRIGEYRRKQDIIVGGISDLTALGILREISELLDPQIPLDTQELSINRNKITIRAYTDSFASVDKIIADLRKNSLFQKIDMGDRREAPGGKKSFQILVTVGSEEKTQPKRRRR